jgi:hypothetical protein
MSDEIPANGTIRITKEEATSAHVDDLLKRQMSMRGAPGVTRDRRRKWYSQNWLVLALAGGFGAFIAWAILSPIFDDQLYIQGPITELKLDETLLYHVSLGSEAVDLRHAIVGSCRINGQRVMLLETLREIGRGGNVHVDFSSLHNGETLGLYVEYREGPQSDLALATFVVRSPKPQSAARAAMTLSQLQARSRAAGMLTFSVVAGLIGLFIGAVDGIVCRLPRRALLSGAVGLVVGFVGGFIIRVIANLTYAPLNALAMRQMAESGVLGAFGFFVQMVARSFAWALVGMAMGLGQGIALRSGRLLVYGLIGGVLGGLFGGLLFDPIDLIVLGPDKPSAQWSRLIGFVIIGLSVGGMIGLVELLARDAWLRMTQGPLTGKEFLIFKDTMTIGSSPRSDLYLFNDPQVARHHATVRAIGDEVEIEAHDGATPVLLNNRPVQRSRLRHGDNVAIGRATFVFQRRKS